VHHLDGRTALAFARSRNASSDFARARRQQRVLRALLDKARHTDLAPKVLEIYGALQGHVATDLSLREMVAMALYATRLGRDDVHTQVMDRLAVRDWVTPDGAQVLLVNPEATAGLLQESLNPERAAAPRLRVTLLDATHVPGLDAVARTRLEERGFAVGPDAVEPDAVGSAAGQAAATRSAAYAVSKAGDPAAVRAVAAALGLADAVLPADAGLPPELRTLAGAATAPGAAAGGLQPDAAAADGVVVLGADWDPCPGAGR
jgi:hypothetical protein